MAEIREKFHYFDYDRLISIDFGSTLTKFAYYDIRNEKLELNYKSTCSNQPSACLYTIYNEDYENAILKEWGNSAEFAKRTSMDTLYIDKLRDKVSYLYNKQKEEWEAIDFFYERAIIDHLNRVYHFINSFINDKYGKNCDASKNRYVMTHPSDWEIEKVNYLRELAILAGIVSSSDHPQRLIMYGEAESILRYVQEDIKDRNSPIKLRQGHNYLICDLGGSKLKTYYYQMIEPINDSKDILGVQSLNWISEHINPILNQGGQNIIEKLELLAVKKLFPDHLFELDYFENKFKDRRKDFGKLSNESSFRKLSNFTGEEKNETYYIPIPFRLQLKTFSKSNLISRRTTIYPSISTSTTSSSSSSSSTSTKRFESISQKSIDKLSIHTKDLLEQVYDPICNDIKLYFEQLLPAYNGKIDTIILVGGFRHTTYLLNLIKSVCLKAGLEPIIPFYDGDKHNEEYKSFEIVCGAIFKSMDTSAAQDPVPRIEYDTSNGDLLTNDESDVIVFIDLGIVNTRCSFTLIQDDLSEMKIDKVEHITEWPGQESFFDLNFPTLNTILIPKKENEPKKIISLKELDQQKFEKRLYNLEGEQKYYSFEQDEYGIILVSHYKSKLEESIKPVSEYEYVEKLQVSEYSDEFFIQVKSKNYNDIESFLKYRPIIQNDQVMRYVNKFQFQVKRERITFKEFMSLYLGYLNDFLRNYISKQTGFNDFSRYRYCITRDNHSVSEEFKLSDQDLRLIAHSCGITEEYSHDFKLLLLNRAEASAIYCRTLIPKITLQNRKNQIYFLQVYMYPNQCILLLNDIPATQDKGSDDIVENWVGMYKHIKSKSVSIDIMDQICNHLWTHLQTYTDESSTDMIKRCKYHTIKGLFNSRNRFIFKSKLQDYLSKAFLDIQDSEKTHIIYICNSAHNCCSISLSNMDLLDFAINPALTNLVSIIQASTLNQDLFRGVQLSDIFLLGEFLLCRDHNSYKFIEHRLISKLKQVNFRRLDSLILLRMTKDTQVRKVEISIPDLEGTCSIAHAVSIGALYYSLDPRNRLLERYTNRTYAFNVTIRNSVKNNFAEVPSVKVFCSDKGVLHELDPTDFFCIIDKNTRISDFPNYEINKYIYLSEEGTDSKIEIGLYESDEENITKWNINNKKFDHIQTFTMKNGYKNYTYPIILRVLLSQTKSIRFWVTYGKEEELGDPINIRENIQLKSYINKE